MNLVIRRSGPTFACKLPVQFCRLLWQEGFIGNSSDLYELFATGHHPSINFCSSGGNILWSDRQTVALQLPPCLHINYEWVSVLLTQQQARAEQEETSAGGPGSVLALSQLSITVWQLLGEQLKWQGRRSLSSADPPSDLWMILLVFPGTYWAYTSIPE